MASILNDLPKDQRPREKLLALGPGSLSNAELLAIFLRTGVPGRNAIAISQELVDSHGSLTNLSQTAVRTIAKQHGIGPAKACQIAAAFELGARAAREQNSTKPLTTPAEIYSFLAPQMRHLRQESLQVISLNTKLHYTGLDELSRGTVNQTTFHPRDVFHAVISRNAYAFVLAHNHPSGDPNPSRADDQITAQLVDAAKLLNIPFIDHIIVGQEIDGKQPYYSYAEHNRLSASC